MTAVLTQNRELALAAAWWLYEGATVLVALADTTGAEDPPLGTDVFEDWIPYLLSEDYDLFLTAGTAAYDATITEQAGVPQLAITLDYADSVTYTDLVLLCLPLIDPGVGSPLYAKPTIGIIEESSAVTLLSTETKTYNLDLYAEVI